MNVLVIGGLETGKSSTVNSLLGKKIAKVNEDSNSSTEKIEKFESDSMNLFDTPGFGENLEKDEKLSNEIVKLLKKENEDKQPFISVVLVVLDSSTRDLGTEYELISNVLIPNLSSKQRVLVALNQCDFAMKGKYWDDETNSPNEKLREFLIQKVDSIHQRIKDSTTLNVTPIYYSALHGYNIDVLRENILGISPEEILVDKNKNFYEKNDKQFLSQVEDKFKLMASKSEEIFEDSDVSITASTDGNDVYRKIKSQVEISTLSVNDKTVLLNRLKKFKDEQLNIMLVGATGAGKSSTINALFGKNVAEVGDSVYSQTDKIEKFVLGNIILWDTPGLGDTPDKDKIFAQQIANMIHQNDSEGNALIDLVLVIIDASTEDLGTTYELVSKVIIPNLSDNRRILLALNQCDFAMKGKYWNREKNTPKQKLEDFLRDKSFIISARIKESTGVDTLPIYYSALYHYNIAKLFFYLLEATPDEKRLKYLSNLNEDVRVWDNNDTEKNYNFEINQTFEGSSERVLKKLLEGIDEGIRVVGNILQIFKSLFTGKK